MFGHFLMSVFIKCWNSTSACCENCCSIFSSSIMQTMYNFMQGNSVHAASIVCNLILKVDKNDLSYI